MGARVRASFKKMSLRFDLHLHTQMYSACSFIDAEALIGRAVKAGLDGVVITEHHYQWRVYDLEMLRDRSPHPGFIALPGFEYTTTQGDILVYGLSDSDAHKFKMGQSPEDAVKTAKDMGAVVIAAHPTRAGMGFDERIFSLPLDAIEIRSGNMKEHEQRLAAKIAVDGQFRTVTASDAHNIRDVGKYYTEFDYPVQTIADLVEAFHQGKFRHS
jgi:predicted metal-dependent phosphoesterase TrpH